MPIYEFNCHSCGNSFDKLVRISATDAVTCPQCQSEQVKKKLSLFSSRVTNDGSSANNSTASCSPGGL